MKVFKSFITLVFSVFFLTSCSSINASKTQPKVKAGEPINFFVATDIHYLSKELTDNGKAYESYVKSGDGKQLNYIDEIVDAFTLDIEKRKPDFLVISGDLTSNGEEKSHLDLAKKLSYIESLGTSVYVIPGNHDVLNPFARKFKGDNQYTTDYITDKDFKNIYESYGYEEAISKDKTTLSYLATPSEDLWLLMLDTSQYKNNIKNKAPQLDGRISDETFQWIKNCNDLAKKKGAKIITVMHHNIIDHSDVIREGFTVNDNEAAIDKFQGLGIDTFLSGHIHIQDISSYEKNGSTIYDIVTESLGIYPQQYGVANYSSKDRFNYSTSKVDVEAWAKESKLTDENLMNFKEYSKDFFVSRAYGRFFNNLLENTNYSEDEMTLMAKTISELNLKYFSGEQEEKEQDIMKSEGFKLLASSDSSFIKRYVESIIHDDNLEDNNLHIPSDGGK